MDRNSTILIIDDEPALLLGLAAKIKRQGYQVVTASDGSEGMQKAKEVLPDLILSDVMMPPPNGFELRRLMGQDPDLASIPFIFLTARTGVEDRVNGIRDGADDYITKPFITEELFARIEAVLRRVQVSQERGREEARASAQQDMEDLKREILQNFHHEMRTPLSNIIMPLELVVNNKFENPEEQIQFVRTALSSVDRLESLVTDFILLTNIDHGDLNRIRQRIDLNNHVLLPIQKRLARYKTKELEFTYEIKGTGEIMAPRREFTHALVHLLDNAFKFNPERGQVKLTLQIDTNGGVMLLVEDTGAGVPQDLREKVFERYYQISQGDNREHDGLGVGLFIAQAVFSSLGGHIMILNSSNGCSVQAMLPNLRPEDIFYG
ncbi:MAG TPA: hybrid sensor histidine kinase/response regulator [Anaerolineales bacterium]|nr:hybrid sensor histidine kinase/response regulator [Anaerolineales bacterium]